MLNLYQMVLLMLMKKPEHKKFEYLPRYYKPEKDKTQNFRERFEITRRSYSIRKKSNKIFLYLIFILVVLYLAIKFGLL